MKIGPKVTYASDIWVLNTKEGSQLKIWEIKFLRGIFGEKKNK